jgi:DNA-directed RNA polymerase subunit L
MMDKEKLLKLLKEALAKDERVIFAYIYGSFVKEQSIRDIADRSRPRIENGFGGICLV